MSFHEIPVQEQEQFLQSKFVNHVVRFTFLQTYPSPRMKSASGKLESIVIGCTVKDAEYALIRLVNHDEQFRVPLEDIMDNLTLLN